MTSPGREKGRQGTSEQCHGRAGQGVISTPEPDSQQGGAGPGGRPQPLEKGRSAQAQWPQLGARTARTGPESPAVPPGQPRLSHGPALPNGTRPEVPEQLGPEAPDA